MYYICTVNGGQLNCSDSYKIDSSKIKYQLVNKKTNETTLKENPEKMQITGSLAKNESISFELKLWIDKTATNKDLYVYENGKPKENSDGSIVTKNAGYKINVEGQDSEFVLPLPTGVETLIAKVGTGGLVADEHPETAQLQATTAYRYTGANPDNYVIFNNETWRIIGVFETDDGTGKLEQRIKIIRNESIGDIAYNKKDFKDAYGNSTEYSTEAQENNWALSTGMLALNSGDYYNRTGTYSSIGLSKESKNMIDYVKWYLGRPGSFSYEPSGYYLEERRKEELYPTGDLNSWMGEVGLIYPSDYGYATSGGTTTSRAICLNQDMNTWDEATDCINNNWLYDNSYDQWLLSDGEGNNGFVMLKGNNNTLIDYVRHVNKYAFKPSLYLLPNILISGGTGTQSDPYQLTNPNKEETSENIKLTANDLTKKAGTGGLVKEEHEATTQLGATTAYRYTGANPDNYITFNNELWRIIGVFEVDDGTGKLEKRMKIIRRDSIGKMKWDDNGTNNWSTATSMVLLNSGDYWNRTGTYASTGLTEGAKTMISNAKWYLGATNAWDEVSGPQFYTSERSTEVYQNNPTSWTGKVAFAYASDYSYAIGDIDEASRKECITTKISGCASYNWLHIKFSSLTLSTASTLNNRIFIVNTSSGIMPQPVSETYYLYPTLYLSTDTLITGGKGTYYAPYIVTKQ